VRVDEPPVADAADRADEARVLALQHLEHASLVHTLPLPRAGGDDAGADDVARDRPAVVAGRDEEILVPLRVGGDDEAEPLAVVPVGADQLVLADAAGG